MKDYDHFHFSFMTKNYKGIFVSWGKLWKGIYWHFSTFTIRTFLWGIDWYSTKEFNKSLKLENDYELK